MNFAELLFAVCILEKEAYLQHEKRQFVNLAELIFSVQKCLNFAELIFAVKQ